MIMGIVTKGVAARGLIMGMITPVVAKLKEKFCAVPIMPLITGVIKYELATLTLITAMTT